MVKKLVCMKTENVSRNNTKFLDGPPNLDQLANLATKHIKSKILFFIQLCILALYITVSESKK